MVVGVALELMGRSIEPMTVLPAVWAIGVIVLVVSLARRRRQVARLSLAATIRAKVGVISGRTASLRSPRSINQ